MAFKIRMKNGDSQTIILNNEFVVTVTHRNGEYLLSSLHLKGTNTKKTIHQIIEEHINEFYFRVWKFLK